MAKRLEWENTVSESWRGHRKEYAAGEDAAKTAVATRRAYAAGSDVARL